MAQGINITLDCLSPAVSQAAIELCETRTEASDVKFTLLSISDQLLDLDAHIKFYKADEPTPYAVSLAMLHNRLHAGKHAPTPIQTPSSSPTKARSRNAKSPIPSPVSKAIHVFDRPLEDFEDLYYALLARIKDLHQMLSIRVNNGFTPPTDIIFDGGPTFAELHYELQVKWERLNELQLVNALDTAVRFSRVKDVFPDLALGREKLKQDVHTLGGRDQEARSVEDDVDKKNREYTPGIAWIGGWPPGMIAAWLEEKYRITLKLEKEEHERNEQLKRAEEAQEEKWTKKCNEETAWRRRISATYEEAKKKREQERERWELARRAESVALYGQYLRQIIGGDYLGLEEQTWTVYGGIK